VNSLKIKYIFPELLERIEESSEDNDWEFLAKPSKEAWAFLADRFERLSKLAHASLIKTDKIWETRDISTMTSRENITLKYMVNERNCLVRFMEITASRRDNDPKDELPGPDEISDENVIELTEKTKALLREAGHSQGMMSRGQVKSVEVFGPVSSLPSAKTK